MNNYEVSFNQYLGFIVSHRNVVQVMVTGYTKVSELSFCKRFSGKNDWELKYNYPGLGLSFFYFNFNNPQYLGNGYALLPYLDFPLTRTKNLKLSFRLGLGPGYIEKVFDPKDNYKNFALSTKLNGFAHAGVKTAYFFNPHFRAGLGISLSHYSNASVKKPNLGINMAMVDLNLAYAFHETSVQPRKNRKEYGYSKRITQDLVLCDGPKEKNPIGGPLYHVISLAYDASKNVSFKSRFGVGSDIFINNSLKGESDGNDEEITEFGDFIQAGLHLSYTLQVSNFSLFCNQGIYIRTAYKYVKDGPYYQRIGMRYLLKDHFIFNFSMKTHFAVADHLEYGIGYRF